MAEITDERQFSEQPKNRPYIIWVAGRNEEDGTMIDLELDDVETIEITTKSGSYCIKGHEIIKVVSHVWDVNRNCYLEKV